MTHDTILGIDLGTTNSEVAATVGDKIEVLAVNGEQIMPSIVSLGTDNRVLVGNPARNQYPLYPDRTVKSVKRLMGSTQQLALGQHSYSPPEISALILHSLKTRAETVLGRSLCRAVITVPAYFSDAQRQATRDAGRIAGLEVVRLLHEPTAAALAYGTDRRGDRTVLIYDLGGGTFDVSLVQVQDEITEVIASHGNNHLGGDDFDQRLLGWVHDRFVESGGPDLRADPTAMNRLLYAVEAAKQRLSFEPYARIREEYLAERNGIPVHLDLEISRTEYEGLIQPLLETTLDSVYRALTDAGKRPEQIDEVLLVGGASRTPLVAQLLEDKTGLAPHQDLQPELCVAYGAGVLAARLAGHNIDRILVDISPYSFGPSHLGVLDGRPYEHCYQPIIRRNTPLPVSRTESYHTLVDGQTDWQVSVYQGHDPDALNNILVGRFCVEGLSRVPAGNEMLCRMELDLDGILKVTAMEKRTGLARHITIEGATIAMSADELARARQRMHAVLAQDRAAAAAAFEQEETHSGQTEPATQANDDDHQGQTSPALPAPETAQDHENHALRQRVFAAGRLLERSRRLLDSMTPEDRHEALGLHQQIEEALRMQDWKHLRTATAQLADLLFYVEEA